MEEAIENRRFRSPAEMIDPGWLFLLAGLAIVACSALIPAIDELNDVRFQRDRAMMLESHRIARISNHERYLAALEREEPALVTSLAATQLNQIPTGRGLVLEPANMFSDPAGSIAASPLVGLEPPPLTLPERGHVDSYLQRLTVNATTRPWVMAGGILCVLIGLLPRTRG